MIMTLKAEGNIAEDCFWYLKQENSSKQGLVQGDNTAVDVSSTEALCWAGEAQFSRPNSLQVITLGEYPESLRE